MEFLSEFIEKVLPMDPIMIYLTVCSVICILGIAIYNFIGVLIGDEVFTSIIMILASPLAGIFLGILLAVSLPAAIMVLPFYGIRFVYRKLLIT